MSQWLRAGVIGRPHGLDGSVHVGQARSGLLTVGVVVRVDGVDRAIERRAGTETQGSVRLAGFGDRDAAEALRGCELYVARESAPALEADEWWAEDLEGCRVHDGEREVGTVTRLLALPSCEVLEVARDGAPLLVPLVSDAVRAVDVVGKSIDVDLRFLGEEA